MDIRAFFIWPMRSLTATQAFGYNKNVQYRRHVRYFNAVTIYTF